MRKKGVLIAVHRGTFGGNIIQNTIPAFENALKHGADILEIDVAQTIDGVFFVFHTGQEPGLLGIDRKLDSLTSRQVLSYQLINNTQGVTSQKINTLDETPEHFKGKCLINIDRGWFYWEDIVRYLDSKGLDDQIILKSPPEEKFLKLLEDNQSRFIYMPLIQDQRYLRQALSYNINLVAAEIIFSSDDNELVQTCFVEEMRNKGLLLWLNAITLNDATILSGKHDDNCAILQNMNDGWGWLIERGFDVIQTNWPSLLRSYIKRYSRENFGI